MTQEISCPVCSNAIRGQEAATPPVGLRERLDWIEARKKTGVVCCADCGVPHHMDCWTYAGTCGIFGCGSIRYSWIAKGCRDVVVFLGFADPGPAVQAGHLPDSLGDAKPRRVVFDIGTGAVRALSTLRAAAASSALICVAVALIEGPFSRVPAQQQLGHLAHWMPFQVFVTLAAIGFLGALTTDSYYVVDFVEGTLTFHRKILGHRRIIHVASLSDVRALRWSRRQRSRLAFYWRAVENPTSDETDRMGVEEVGWIDTSLEVQLEWKGWLRLSGPLDEDGSSRDREEFRRIAESADILSRAVSQPISARSSTSLAWIDRALGLLIRGLIPVTILWSTYLLVYRSFDHLLPVLIPWIAYVVWRRAG